VPASAPALLVSSSILSSVDTLDSILLRTPLCLRGGGSSLSTLSISHPYPSVDSPPCSSLGARFSPSSTRVVIDTLFRRHPRLVTPWDSFVVAPWWFCSAQAVILSPLSLYGLASVLFFGCPLQTQLYSCRLGHSLPSTPWTRFSSDCFAVAPKLFCSAHAVILLFSCSTSDSIP
jgi:hypothetical protein